MRFKCAVFAVAVVVLGMTVFTEAKGGSSSSHSYPHSSGLSGSGSQSHSYPHSSGLSGFGSSASSSSSASRSTWHKWWPTTHYRNGGLTWHGTQSGPDDSAKDYYDAYMNRLGAGGDLSVNPPLTRAGQRENPPEFIQNLSGSRADLLTGLWLYNLERSEEYNKHNGGGMGLLSWPLLSELKNCALLLIGRKTLARERFELPCDLVATFSASEWPTNNTSESLESKKSDEYISPLPVPLASNSDIVCMVEMKIKLERKSTRVDCDLLSELTKNFLTTKQSVV